MDQQSLQAGDLGTEAFGYVAPQIVRVGSVGDFTMGVSGAGTDSTNGSSLGPGFS
jgi:hypothetical protein